MTASAQGNKQIQSETNAEQLQKLFCDIVLILSDCGLE